jgi:hypothetical protein
MVLDGCKRLAIKDALRNLTDLRHMIEISSPASDTDSLLGYNDLIYPRCYCLSKARSLAPVETELFLIGDW